MMDIVTEIKIELHSKSSPEKALVLQRFFKTKKGEYGEGDVFIGVTTPVIREMVKKFYKDLSLNETQILLHSKIHEERALALLILVEKFQKNKDEKSKKSVVDFYISKTNLAYINNWDLVDLSCYKILGTYLISHPNEVDLLYKFSSDNNFWIRRMSIVSTLSFIKKDHFEHTLKIAEILLKDNHNLIHKATGWMLREMGKRNKQALLDFIKKNLFKMPKITLSYAIEKLSIEEKSILVILRKAPRSEELSCR